MPHMSANQAAIRASGNWMRVYVSFLTGNVVATGTITATPANGATTLAITVSTGSAANIKRGMTVYIKSAAGVLKGVTRVRYSDQTIDATNLPIRENARGTINIVSGDTWEVRDDIRLSDKLVEADEAFNPDGLAYSDQNSDQRPIACSGGHWAGDVSMLPITTAGSASVTVDPDSAGTVSHLWTPPSGLTFASGTSTSANPTFTGPAGEYWVTHAVTDTSNSETTTQYVGYKITDDNDPPFEGLMEAPSGDEENGWSARFRPFDPVLLTSIPDNCLAIVWKQEYIAGVQQSFGAAVPGRSHILMTGYLRREDGAFTGDTGVEELTFEIISPMARLQELIGYSKVMISEASPDAWSEVKTLTVRRAILQIVAVYTSLQQSGFDFIVHSNYSDAVYPRFYLQKAEPLAQLRELADGRDARIICDRTGRFELQTRPELIPIGDRAAAVITLAIDSEDFVDWSYTREHDGTVEIVECQGFTAGSTPAPVFSRWPGLTPGTGNEATVVTRLIVDSQTDCNQRCGRRGAALNSVYMDANGLKQQAVDLTLVLPGSYHVFDFYGEYVQFDKVTTLRGLDFLDQLFYLKSATYEPDDKGAGKVRLTLRTATNAVAGQTYTPPLEADSNLPTINDPDLEWGPMAVFSPGNPFLLNKGTKRLVYFNDDGNMYRTSDGDTYEAAGGPTYEAVLLSGLGLDGSVIMDAIPNAFSPKYLGTGDDTNGWILTDREIGYITDVGDIGSGISYAAEHTFAAAPAGVRRVMQAERGVEGWALVASSYIADKGTVTWRDPITDVWAEVTVTTNHDTTLGENHTPSLWMDPHVAGHAIVIFFKATSATPNGGAYETVDYGATWSAITNPALATTTRLGGTMDGPYAASNTYYYGNAVITTTYVYSLKKEVSGVLTDVSPTISATTYGPEGSGGKRQIRTHDTDANKVLFIGTTNADPATTKIGVFTSLDGAASWRTAITPDNANQLLYQGGAIGGDGLATYLWGTDYLWYSADFLLTPPESKMGNLSGIGLTLNLWGW